MALPDNTGPRLSARALLVENGKLLLVNAYPDAVNATLETILWCAPGGGIEKHQSVPDNLAREVFEETGLTVEIGALVGFNEFHDPDGSFHQVDLFFRARLISGQLTENWRDADEIVTQRRFFSRDELAGIRYKPDRMQQMAFDEGPVIYDPLEQIIL